MPFLCAVLCILRHTLILTTTATVNIQSSYIICQQTALDRLGIWSSVFVSLSEPLICFLALPFLCFS